MTGSRWSVAIEYDPWQNIASDWQRVPNAIGDPSDNHISVHTRGLIPNNANQAYSLGSTSAVPDLADGAEHVLWLNYTPGTASGAHRRVKDAVSEGPAATRTATSPQPRHSVDRLHGKHR
jgi:hypothetical protein